MHILKTYQNTFCECNTQYFSQSSLCIQSNAKIRGGRRVLSCAFLKAAENISGLWSIFHVGFPSISSSSFGKLAQCISRFCSVLSKLIFFKMFGIAFLGMILERVKNVFENLDKCAPAPPRMVRDIVNTVAVSALSKNSLTAISPLNYVLKLTRWIFHVFHDVGNITAI